jgi:hypothetical protein
VARAAGERRADGMNSKRAPPPAPAHGAPPPKRLQIDAARSGAEALAQLAPTSSSPVKRQLRRGMLVLFFVSAAQVYARRLARLLFDLIPPWEARCLITRVLCGCAGRKSGGTRTRTTRALLEWR